MRLLDAGCLQDLIVSSAREEYSDGHQQAAENYQSWVLTCCRLSKASMCFCLSSGVFEGHATHQTGVTSGICFSECSALVGMKIQTFNFMPKCSGVTARLVWFRNPWSGDISCLHMVSSHRQADDIILFQSIWLSKTSESSSLIHVINDG